MESLVPFKTFTFWNKDQPAEVRRFGIEQNLVTNFQYLSAKLQDTYPGLKGKKFHVSWKDEEDDDVRISSDEDLLIALSNVRDNMVKLNIFYVDSDDKEDSEIFINAPYTAAAGNVASSSDAKAKHLGVICDGCDAEIEGFRYKCTCCYDYDLCSTCEAACVHPEHCMVRVPTPAMPRELIKAAIKRSRYILKNLSAPAGDCTYKRHRRDRSGERRRDHHGAHGDRHGEQHHRRPRGSWLDTFATYMNEFVDLAGGIDLDVDSKRTGAKPKETQTQEQPKETKESVNAQTQQPETEQRAEAAAAANQAPRCPFAPQPLNFVQIQKLLQDIYTPTQSCNANTSAGSTSEQPAPGNTAEKTALGDIAGAEVSANAVGSSTETTSKPTGSGEGSMDRTDDWTLINKEKDLMDTSENNAVDPTPPIGFNLPLEFQTRMSINGAAATSIYPTLNVATAVMNPKEPEAKNPEVSKPAEAPKRSSPPPAAQPSAPTPAPRERHPIAHIDAAIEQMLFMGFTNEGGWLTKLLESKDGNIAEVIDLLTPHPK